MNRPWKDGELHAMESIVDQIRGFHERGVTRSGTTERILRRAFRILDAPVIATTVEAQKADGVTEKVEDDHIVPVKWLAHHLIKQPSLTIAMAQQILAPLLFQVTLTKKQHTSMPKDLRDDMPEGWSPTENSAANLLIRYRRSAIDLVDLVDPSEFDWTSRRASRRAVGAHRGKFPLKKFYSFARENHLSREALAIENTPVPATFGGSASAYHRPLAITLLEEHSLMQEFAALYWPAPSGSKESPE